MPARPLILSLSGHDPGGGAGIQADIEAINALGGTPATLVTCLTVQDTVNVQALIPIDAALLERQARTLLEDYGVAAIKIGLIGTPEIAAVIGRILALAPTTPVILDPVLAAGGGTPMAGVELIRSIRTELLPRTLLITPNSPEARRLSGRESLDEAAESLLALGARSVLITGTHEAEERVTNRLFRPGHAHGTLNWPRLPGQYHGSGCTLASACATLIGLGLDLEQAVEQAQGYTWRALDQATRPGRGQALPNRLHQNRGPQ
ncbi:MAG: hydroxymethylpyrimidine/phosphomethylpyrimidine kinase [Candidatus Sedimenticola endophacoides]